MIMTRTATALCAGLCLCAFATRASADPAPAPGSLTEAVQTELRLTNSSIQTLAVDTRPGVAFRMDVRLDGVLHTLHLTPHSTRAPGYRLIAQVEDGSFVEMEPGPVRTVRGVVVGQPDSWIAGGTDEYGFDGTLMLEDGTRYWIESLAEDFVTARAGEHAVYRNDSIIPPDHKCGNEVKPNGIDDDDGQDPEVNGAPALLGGAFYDVELACDADVQYFNDYGSINAVENRINVVTNTMNPQYETQVQIRHLITTIIVRTAEPDPYTSSTSDTLLCQFITEWTNNQQGIAFDVAKLFTGREISGGTIGQAANFGEICDRQGCCDCAGGSLDDGAFCYSQSDCCGGLGCSTDLMAHELGHLWNAFHCGCTEFTMNSFITCANQFSAGTISDIIAHRNSRTCLDPPFIEPADGACCLVDGTCDFRNEDECDTAGGLYLGDDTPCESVQCPAASGACCLVDGQCAEIEQTVCSAVGGLYQGNGVTCAGVNCPQPDSGACCFDDGACTVVSPATCSNTGGTYQGDDVTCGAANCSPPAGACCFDSGSCSVQTADDCANGGGTYEGDDTTCGATNCPQPCPADLDGDENVGFNDLLSLLSSWGPCPSCPADLDLDNNVGFTDLLIILTSWGPCP